MLDDIKSYDEIREAEIKELGLTVMRFKNEEIFSEAQNVVEKIEAYLNSVRPHP